jgi:hypothetical protein
MSESGDYDPGPWRGHDFTSAYRAYDSHAGRSYDDAKAVKKEKKDLLEATISTNCRNPLVIFSDVTGSMGEWPKVMFSKLPYLEHEAKEYLGDDLEISFAAIGDAYSDQYPLQVRAFSKGTALKDRMLELVIEGNGGGQLHETYELGALYALKNIDMPKAIKPILIMIGDEMPYDTISKDVAEYAGVKLKKQLSTTEVFEELKSKFAVYFIRKPYGSSGGDGMSANDREIRNVWVSLLGADHVCDLPAAERVVDVIFGILAKETARIEYFKEEIEGRQRPDQVATVYKSLASIHTSTGKGARSRAGQSIMKIEDKGLRSRKLLGRRDEDE